MKATAWAALLIGMLLVFAGGWFAGSEHASEKQHDKLTTANVNAALWESTATSQQGAIEYFKRHTEQQQKQLRVVRFVADAVLEDRDALQIKYDNLRNAQKNANTKAAHEDPDCADLARPLCPAVAERVFRAPGNDPAGDH